MALPEDTPLEVELRERWVTKPPGVPLPEDNPQQTPGEPPKRNTREQAEFDIKRVLAEFEATRVAHQRLQAAYDEAQAELTLLRAAQP